MEKSNLILFTDSYYPFKDSTSKINTIIANNISQYDEITIVCARNLFSKDLILEKVSENLLIRRLPIPFVNTRSIPLKIIKFISFALLISTYLLLKKRSRSIYLVSTSPPVIIPLLAFFIKIENSFRSHNIKKILLAQDIYPDILVSVNNSSIFKKSILRILNIVYKYSYKEFDLTISCCEPIKNKLIKKYKVKESKIKVINNWSLIDHNVIRNQNRYALENGQTIKMFLIGNVGKVHLYQQTAGTLRNILNKSNLIDSLHMYTSGAHHLDMRNELKDLKNVFLHKPVNANDLAKAYSSHSITIVPLTQTASECAFPSRIATAMSLGSPIIVITDSILNNYLSDFINKYNIGLILTKKDILNEHDFISEDFKTNFNFYQKNCLRLYKELFTKEENLNTIVKVIKSI